MSYWKSYSSDPYLTSISQVSARVWNEMYNGVGREFNLEQAFGFSMTPTNEMENSYSCQQIPGMSRWYDKFEKEGKQLIKSDFNEEDIW